MNNIQYGLIAWRRKSKTDSVCPSVVFTHARMNGGGRVVMLRVESVRTRTVGTRCVRARTDNSLWCFISWTSNEGVRCLVLCDGLSCRQTRSSGEWRFHFVNS